MDKYERMQKLKNNFYLEFSALCHLYLDKVPEADREEFKGELGDLTSIYGTLDKEDLLKMKPEVL